WLEFFSKMFTHELLNTVSAKKKSIYTMTIHTLEDEPLCLCSLKSAGDPEWGCFFMGWRRMTWIRSGMDRESSSQSWIKVGLQFSTCLIVAESSRRSPTIFS